MAGLWATPAFGQAACGAAVVVVIFNVVVVVASVVVTVVVSVFVRYCCR